MPQWDRSVQNTTDTKGQKKLAKVLREIGFEVENEVPVGIYSIDCFVRELCLAFEFDGPSHTMRKNKDKKRDEWLLSLGIPTFRVKVDIVESRYSSSKLTQDILEFVKQWEDSVLVRQRLAEGYLG